MLQKVLVGENVQRLEGEDVLPIIPPRVPGNFYLNTNKGQTVCR